ncbi:hypothetical protein BXO88_10225 [Oribacterium sp. C9]|uniref:hypothetical protein n=1 Tax=Oribacterium sp. C9 TaxID=1943579 RepID=UPI00098F60B0|nr:hypothetical protein [Oribacterium sp. C9]OON85810.1 hypothetical protein BXO88_10225 [Oribacterium sp. C9]
MIKVFKKRIAIIMAMTMLLAALPFTTAYAKTNKKTGISEGSSENSSSSSYVGTTKDNVYENEYIGYRVALPKGYSYAGAKALAEENGYSVDFITDSDAVLKKIRNGETITVAYAESDTDYGNMNIGLVKDDTVYSSEKEVFELVRDEIKEGLQGAGMTLRDSSINKSYIAGEKRNVIYLHSTLDEYDVDIHQKIVMLSKDGYWMIITVSVFGDEAAADEFLDKIEKIGNTASSENIVGTVKKNVYINEYVGYKVTLPDGYKFADSEELAEMNGVTTDVMDDYDEIMKVINSNNSFVAAYAMNDAKEIFELRVLKYDDPASIDDYLFGDDMQNYYRQFYKDTGYTVKDINIKKETVAGDKHKVMSIQTVKGETTFCGKSLYVGEKDYFLFISTSNYSKNGADSMLGSIEKL